MKKIKNPLVRGVLSAALVALGVVLYPKDGVEMSGLIWRSLASGLSLSLGMVSLLLLLFPYREGRNKS